MLHRQAVFCGAVFILFLFHSLFPDEVSSQAASGAAPHTGGASPSLAAKRPQNIILFIGDGMGPQQIGLLLLARKHAKELGIPKSSALVDILTSGSLALVQPQPSGALVIDSACSATALATGHLGLPETLGVDADGKTPPTIVNIASGLGMSTGLVSDTRITHATPAAFYARAPHRSDENEIAAQLIESDVSVALSGGVRHFAPKGSSSIKGAPFRSNSSRSDTRNLLEEARLAETAVVFSQRELEKTKAQRVLGLFSESAMQNAFLEAAPHPSQPTLRAMTTQALRLLSRDPDGFFLMVEAGQIDWAAHANDAGWLLREMLRADEALQAILDWMGSRNDTLLVVTADHETGGFGFSYHASDIPAPRPFPGRVFSNESYKPQYNFVPPSVLGELLLQKAPLGTVGEWWEKLSSGERTSKALGKRLQETIGVQLEDEALTRIMAMTPNHFYREGHKDLGEKEWTALCSYDAFHPNARNRFSTAVSRELASHYGVVWATGTHTSTPVLAAWVGGTSFNPPRLMSMEALGAELIKQVSVVAPAR
jgi:alkaline phosphatase